MENFVCKRQKAGEAWDDEDDSCLLSAYYSCIYATFLGCFIYIILPNPHNYYMKSV